MADPIQLIATHTHRPIIMPKIGTPTNHPKPLRELGPIKIGSIIPFAKFIINPMVGFFGNANKTPVDGGVVEIKAWHPVG